MKAKTLDEYYGSQEYCKDVAKLANSPAGKMISAFGGFTERGYTRHETVSGEFVSIPVNSKK